MGRVFTQEEDDQKQQLAVLAPMPSASISTAITVNPGALRKTRRANFI
jgi:hypothetical protein